LAMSLDTDDKKSIKKLGPNRFKVAVKEFSRSDRSIVVQKQKLVNGSFAEAKKVRRELKAGINTIYEWGIEVGRIRGINASSANGVRLIGKKVEKQTEILTPEQITTVLRLSREYESPWYPIWLAAVHSGGRSGELQALEWGDIDFENRLLSFNKSYNKRTKSVNPTTKGGYWRYVPINDELLQLLKQLRLESGGNNYVLPRITNWQRGEQARELKTFLFQIGLPQIKFHTLRVCFATHLLRKGVPVAVVMKIGGWNNIETMQRYVRLAGIDIAGATASLKYMSPEEALSKVVHLYKEQ